MAAGYPSPRYQVLVAENDALIGLNLQDELELGGYNVAGPFPTCSASLHWLKENTPDAAVLDIHLSDGACVELANELTRLEVPFAVYSGELEADALPAFKDAKWINKPAKRTLCSTLWPSYSQFPRDGTGRCARTLKRENGPELTSLRSSHDPRRRGDLQR